MGMEMADALPSVAVELPAVPMLPAASVKNGCVFPELLTPPTNKGVVGTTAPVPVEPITGKGVLLTVTGPPEPPDPPPPVFWAETKAVLNNTASNNLFTRIVFQERCINHSAEIPQRS